MKQNVDIAIVGGGIVGCAIADAATRQGFHVGLYTAGSIGDGATAAGMGHIVALDDDPAEFALCTRSSALWQEWREVIGAEYHGCGTLWIATCEAELGALAVKKQRLSAAGIAVEEIAGPDLHRIEPQLRNGFSAGLRVPSDAVVYAPRIARLMSERALAAGAVVCERTTVTAIDGSSVTLGDGRQISAGAIVIAAGIDTDRLLPELAFIPRKGHLVITDRAPLGLVNHQVVEIGYGASAHGSSDSIAFNIQPRPTGQLLIGASRQIGNRSRNIDLPIVHRLMQRALYFMPTIADLRAIRTWTGIRPGTPDGLPYIGPVPGRLRTFVAAGHEGIGITTALATAELLLAQITSRATTLDAAPFSPARTFLASQHGQVANG